MRCAIYSRVSTDAQERDGTSLDTQERACRDHADRERWSVVASHRDAASGFQLERPGLQQLRRLVHDGQVEIVLAYALDRLSRKQTHVAILIEECEQAGVAVAFVTESFEQTATGQLLRSVKAFAAELEREKIAERTMRGKVERARAGKLPQGTGRGFYGYRYDVGTGRREIEPAQARIVQRLFEAFQTGSSCHGLAVQLNAEGVPAFAGGPWHALTVRRLLRNESYTGRTVYRRTRAEKIRVASGGKRRIVTEQDGSAWIPIEGATPALITSDLFIRVAAILDDPTRLQRSQPSRVYQLRGRLRCLVCGTPMVGQALQGGRYTYYRCRRSYGTRTEGRCRSQYIGVELLERLVREQVADVLCDPDRLLLEARRLADANPESARRGELERERDTVLGQQQKLTHLYLKGAMPEDVLAAEGTRLRRERERVERDLTALAAGCAPAADLDQLAHNLPRALAHLHDWVVSDASDLQTLLRALQVEVSASRDEVRIAGVIPDDSGLEVDDEHHELVTIVQTSGYLSSGSIRTEGLPYTLPGVSRPYGRASRQGELTER